MQMLPFEIYIYKTYLKGSNSKITNTLENCMHFFRATNEKQEI